MTELQHTSGIPELYERLINRLGLALETASTAVRLRNEVPEELELKGLSNAEIELIEAYLEKETNGSNGAVKGQAEDCFKVAPEPSGTRQAPQERARVIWLNDRRQAGSLTRSGRYTKTTFRF